MTQRVQGWVQPLMVQARQLGQGVKGVTKVAQGQQNWPLSPEGCAPSGGGAHWSWPWGPQFFFLTVSR